MQHRDHVIDVVVEIEAPFGERHHAGIDPFGDVDVVVRQERLDGAAQQRRVVARHRRDDQQFRLRAPRRMLERALEMQQPAERPLPHAARCAPARARRRPGWSRCPIRAGCSGAWCARTVRTRRPRPCRRRCAQTDWRDSCRRCARHPRRRARASAPRGPSRRTSTSAPRRTDYRRRAALLPRRTHRLACGLAPARLFALQHAVVFSSCGQHGRPRASISRWKLRPTDELFASLHQRAVAAGRGEQRQKGQNRQRKQHRH